MQENILWVRVRSCLLYTSDYLGKILSSSNHLLSLINDILDMSRIESGKIHLEETEVSLSEVLHDLKTIISGQIHAKQLELYMDVMDVTNEDVYCDKTRLNQVLLNLLSNDDLISVMSILS